MSELNFTDLIEPVAVNQNTALRITVLGVVVLVLQWPIPRFEMAAIP